MDTKQPNALRLADALGRAPKWQQLQAAAKLRRQHAEIDTLRTGYNAARLEIESLQARVQEHVRSGKDWAMRAEALERTITTLRAQIASRNAQVAAAEKAMRELESANSIALQLDARIKELEGQLDAVGAGGVEPLRKRECLHQITEPDHFRGATEMVTAARQPLDDKAILQGRTDGYDAEDPPEGWAFAQGVRFAERAHGITQEPQ